VDRTRYGVLVFEPKNDHTKVHDDNPTYLATYFALVNLYETPKMTSHSSTTIIKLDSICFFTKFRQQTTCCWKGWASFWQNSLLQFPDIWALFW